MRSTWSPSEQELKDYADAHIAYEIRTLLYQVVELARWHQRGRVHDMTYDALIEAPLVHLRLLDEFLGSRQQVQPLRAGDRDTVFAAHYLPTWQPASFLTVDERRDVNAQVAHLSGRRKPQFPWSILDLTARCCEGLERYFAAIAHDSAHSSRAAMFSQSRVLVRRFRASDDLDRDFPTTA